MVPPIQTISLAELQNALVSQNFDLLRLDKKFDLEKYRQITARALTEHPPQSKDGYSQYKGLGLQYANEANLYFDVVEQSSFITPSAEVSNFRDASSFSRKNPVGEKYDEFFSFFGEVGILIRGRILVAAPGFQMTEHTDGAFCATLHFPIQTHQDCVMYIDGREYSIPADGHFYVVNVAKPHYVMNRSPIDRIHITFPLTPLRFYDWKRSELNKMKSFFKMFNLTDLSTYKHLRIDESN